MMSVESSGANCFDPERRWARMREAFRARSNAELVSKLEVAIQELDESMYWMEILIEANLVTPNRLEALMAESNELMAILVTSVRTIKRRKNKGAITTKDER